MQPSKRILAFVLALLGVHFSGYAQNSNTPPYKIISNANWVMAKNCYLLTLLQNDTQANALIKADTALQRLVKDKINAVNTSLRDCKAALCLPAVLHLSQAEIRLAGSRMAALIKPGNALDNLIRNHLIPSGRYSLYQTQQPAELLIKAWEQDASAINHIIDVYAEGKKPNYPQIDSISYDVSKKGYYTLMYDCSYEVADAVKAGKLFFEPALYAASIYLEMNERQNAGDYEPMAQTVNKPAVDRVKQIKWASYPYSHILVPGAGPDQPGTPLSGEGMLRCKLAARQYFNGKAPFIVVSGGSVHPYKTRFNEAAEMKRYMINTLGIPQNAVMMEPHSRHTTTNIRNDVRLVFQYHIPFDKPGLIITDKYQTDFIVNMEKRCLNELGYVPYKLGKRLSTTALAFYPVITSLQIDADEPMDP